MTLAILFSLSGGIILWQASRLLPRASHREAIRETSFSVVAGAAMLAMTIICAPALADVPNADGGAEAVATETPPAATPAENKSEAEAPLSEDSPSQSQAITDRIEAEIQEALSKSTDISFESGESMAELVTKEQPDWLKISSEESLVNHKRVVASELHFTAQETEKDLLKATREAVNQYINGYLGDDKACYLVRIDDNYIRNNLMSEQFDEIWKVKQFDKQMYRRHALLDFNDGFRTSLDQQWRDVLQTSKLLTTGLGAFGLLGLLGISFVYLRLDTATKGYYSGRLQFLSAVAILALSAAGVLFANINADWLRWM